MPMPACPKLLACGLNRCVTTKDALRVWQSFYCEGCFGRCERYKLASTGAPIPERLLPNGRLQEASPQPVAVAAGGRG